LQNIRQRRNVILLAERIKRLRGMTEGILNAGDLAIYQSRVDQPRSTRRETGGRNFQSMPIMDGE
jgi:hypothetical protein